MGSMLTATVLGIFFTPLFFVSARRWLGTRREGRKPEDGRPGIKPDQAGES